jgi:hypothetical protein
MFIVRASRSECPFGVGALLLLALGCSGAATTGEGSGTGGVPSNGGSSANNATGGAMAGGGLSGATGGATATGGSNTGTGGIAASGGAMTGGKSSTGGAVTGGAVSTGGSNAGIGGAPASGGAMTGGKSGTGGARTGGAAPTGGSNASTGGALASGGSTNSGVCATGLGAAFPAVTSYTARDGGFGPVAVTRRTGDASLGTDATGAANTVAIFRPAAAKYGQGGVRHPVIVWGNGHTNTVDIWAGFLGRVATYGFVVVAPEQTEVTADEMNKALDYVVSLANDPTSGDCGKIDTTKLGSTGYSLGGMGAITVGSNARITSTFLFASNGNVKNIKAPWGVIGGDADTTFSFSAISTAVTGSTQPAFGASLAGIDHNGVAGQAKSQEGYIGWMRWRFMGDQAGHDMFVGPNCQICTDTAFSGVVKSPTFDSL